MTNRRQFLQSGLAATAALNGLPEVFLRAAWAADKQSDDSVLVVVQMSGGNDGLNTVVPFRDALYVKNRPTLRVNPSDALKINDDLGFHPAARGLADLLEADRLSIVQNVGYANPNRSHFESMDIWHSCSREKNTPRKDGWLGRFLQERNGSSESDSPAIHFGSEKQPLALASEKVAATSIRSLDRFRLNDQGLQNQRQLVSDLASPMTPGADDLLGFIQTGTQAALKVSRRIAAATKTYRTSVTWPDSALGNKLRNVAQLIHAGLSTRVYYVTVDGFDTHARQAATHASLLRELGDATSAFIEDVNEHGHGDRVCLLCFSEFGRRVAENASKGTDHGTAAPLFIAGNTIKAGLHGTAPNLENLQDGDLKFDTDFRCVYATLLEKWLGCSSESVLGGKYASLPLFG